MIRLNILSLGLKKKQKKNNWDQPELKLMLLATLSVLAFESPQICLEERDTETVLLVQFGTSMSVVISF